MSLSLYTLLFFCAPLIADFFHEPDLTPLARYVFAGFVISSLNIVPRAYLFRELKVKQNTIISFVALLTSGIVGVTMAWQGFAYWGIATHPLFTPSAQPSERIGSPAGGPASISRSVPSGRCWVIPAA